MKPKITLSVIIHLPDFGNLSNALGKIANKVKGNAKAIEKNNIPKIGFICKPLADCTKMLPIKGPVQEKETNTNVKAIKNTPRYPPCSDFLSIDVIRLEGIVNSKNPIKEIPNRTKRTKNRIFGIHAVANSLAVCGPTKTESITPKKVNIKTIDAP